MSDEETLFVPRSLDFTCQTQHAAHNSPVPTDWAIVRPHPQLAVTRYRRHGVRELVTDVVQVDLTSEETAALEQLLRSVAARAR